MVVVSRLDRLVRSTVVMAYLKTSKVRFTACDNPYAKELTIDILFRDQPTYDRLSQIAPTVVQSSAFPDEETPWDVQLVTTGQALGREEQALALVDQVNAKIAEAKAANPSRPITPAWAASAAMTR